MKIISSLLFLFMMQQGIAQEKTVAGTVKNEQNGPVEFANIIVSNPATGNTITYCISDAEGNFSFKISSNAGKARIAVSAIGYKQLALVFSLDTIKTLDLKMEPDSQTLKEVIVTTKKEGDTLKLGIDSMNLTSESTLRDILNKTEGVMVTKDGAISYNGKQIAKILLNGKEVFINQNKVALDNLDYEIMDGVQIINNYKDRFNIDFNSLTTPVINIKTKAKFKGVFKFIAEGGLGYKNAYKIKGKAFFFSDNINRFLTSNTNNISEKDFSFKDISPQLLDNASVFLRNTLLPFFVEDNLLEKDFNSNTSLTLRKQTEHSKIGAVVNFASNRSKRKTATTISTADSIIRQENYTGVIRGNLLTTVLNYSHLFSRKTVLSNNAVMGFVSQYNKSENDALNFNPVMQKTNEQNNGRPFVYSIANYIKLTSLLSKKILVNTGINYFTEQTKTNFNTLLTGFPNNDIRQDINLRRHIASLGADLAWRYKPSLSFRAGLGYTYTKENGSIKYPANGNARKSIGRTLNNYNATIGLQGDGKKIEYAASFTPMLFNLREAPVQSRIYPRANVSLTYKPGRRENIIVRYNRDATLFDLNSSYDTIIQSYNFNIFNDPLNKYNVSRDKRLDAGFYHSNVGKSKSFYVSYAWEQNSNFVQLIFDTIANNIFYYRNLVVDNRRKQSIHAGGSKGFYLAPHYHKLEFIAGVSYSSEKFPTVTNHATQQYRNRVWQGNIETRLQLQTYIVKEIKIGAKYYLRQLDLDESFLNRQSATTGYLSIAGNTGATEWKLDLEDVYYKTSSAKFHAPGFDLLFRYKVSEKLSFAVAGKSLFNVFGITNTNNSSVNTFSDGNLVTQIVNTSRIGYLLLNTIYKF